MRTSRIAAASLLLGSLLMGGVLAGCGSAEPNDNNASGSPDEGAPVATTNNAAANAAANAEDGL